MLHTLRSAYQFWNAKKECVLHTGRAALNQTIIAVRSLETKKERRKQAFLQ